MRISDWSSDVCSSDLNCGEQREWIGFSNRQCVATDNSVEHTSPAERFDQMVRKSLRLIGANREPEALDPQLFEREFQSRIGCRKRTNIVGIVFQEYGNGSCDQFLRRISVNRQSRSAEHTSELQSLLRISY